MNDVTKRDWAVLALIVVLVFFAGLLVGNVKSTLSFNQMLEEEKLYLVDKAVVDSCVGDLTFDNYLAQIDNMSLDHWTNTTTTQSIK